MHAGGLVAQPPASYIGAMKNPRSLNPLALPARLFRRAPRINVVRLQGMIAAQGRGRLNDAELAPLLERAFRAGKPKAVALLINSPGGSPVQSSLIAARIRRLADETGVPVHAFVEDAAASGGYWLATAADDIHCDSCSIVGSIGVISAGFGLQELIARHGVERRVHTAGRSKNQLDMFRAEQPEDVEKLNQLLAQMHDAFIAQVRMRRGARLNAATELFDGSFWLGAEAVRLGLADAIGHVVPVMKARYGDKARMVPYGVRRPFLARFGMALATDAMAVADERALWARLGV